MWIVAILAIVISLLSLGVSVALLRYVQRLESRVHSAERGALLETARPVLPEPEEDAKRPLEGLRVTLSVTQDHPHPVFANLLKEQLLKEGVVIADENEDILIDGNLVGNGYAEIYYQADFTCTAASEPICTFIERPPHGDRPGNLAIEIVTKLKTEMEKIVERDERRRALHELGH